MYPPPQWGPPPEQMHKDAARSFLSGFTGCLGVGFALLVVFVALVILISVSNH
jgi:hypothetical protein